MKSHPFWLFFKLFWKGGSTWKIINFDCLFCYFVKGVPYEISSILLVFSYFEKLVAHEKSSILTVFNYFVKGVPHEKSWILIVFQLFCKRNSTWKTINFDCCFAISETRYVKKIQSQPCYYGGGQVCCRRR